MSYVKSFTNTVSNYLFEGSECLGENSQYVTSKSGPSSYTNVNIIQQKIKDLKNASHLNMYCSGLKATWDKSKQAAAINLAQAGFGLVCTAGLAGLGLKNLWNEETGLDRVYFGVLGLAVLSKEITSTQLKNTVRTGYEIELSEIVNAHKYAHHLTESEKQKIVRTFACWLSQRCEIDLETDLENHIAYTINSRMGFKMFDVV